MSEVILAGAKGISGGGGSSSTTIDISNAVINLDFTNKTYDGKPHEPKITSVTLQDQPLIEGQDYVCISSEHTNGGDYELQIIGISKYSGVAKKAWKINKATREITTDPPALFFDTLNTTKTVKINISGTDPDVWFYASPTGEYIDIEKGNKELKITSRKVGSEQVYIFVGEDTNYLMVQYYLTVNITEKTEKIYGVLWGATANSKLVRTDDAALFEDPFPKRIVTPEYESEYSIHPVEGSSPFDNIAPWSEIKKQTISDNEMVSIPKFYYKYTSLEGNAFKLQISPTQLAGFSISPAHADRKDGKGERNTVYVGRYICAADDYKSKTGAELKKDYYASFRRAIQNFGTGWYVMDWAMWATIQMLYLVECADFSFGKVFQIYDRGGGFSPVVITGSTDNIDYPTGANYWKENSYAMQDTQYRWLEGLLFQDNVLIDGALIEGYKGMSAIQFYASTDIGHYDDTSYLPGGNDYKYYTRIATIDATGWTQASPVKYLGIPDNDEYTWALYPKERGEKSNSYVGGLTNLYTSSREYISTLRTSSTLFTIIPAMFYSAGSQTAARLMYLP